MTIISLSHSPSLALSSSHRLIRLWLIACLVCVGLMVFVGGVTRLTESGLSIVEWKLLSGVLPPLTQEGWEAELEAYRATPEYQQINRGMSVAEFKRIFWLEWLHRLLGRITGLVFLLPYLYFLARGQLDRRMQWRGLVGGLLVAAQGGVGWVMVQSGLIDDPRVSPVKLAMHLGLAFAVFAFTLWSLWGLPVIARRRGSAGAAIQSAGWLRQPYGLPRHDVIIIGITALAFLQIILGALVAGLDAGMTYNTWPLMDGDIVPGGLMLLEPWHRNLIENVTTVQFQHRMTAYLLTAAILGYALWLWRSDPAARRRALWLGGAILLQFALGVLTLIHVVPLALASAHQMAALLLWALLMRECYETHRARLQLPA